MTSLEDIDNIVLPKKDYYAWIHLAWGGINREEINDEEIHKQNHINSIKCLNKAKELNCEKFIETGSRAECGNEDAIIPEEISCEQIWNYLDVRDAAKTIVCLIGEDFKSCEGNHIINIASETSRPLKEYIYYL